MIPAFFINIQIDILKLGFAVSSEQMLTKPTEPVIIPFLVILACEYDL